MIQLTRRGLEVRPSHAPQGKTESRSNPCRLNSGCIPIRLLTLRRSVTRRSRLWQLSQNAFGLRLLAGCDRRSYTIEITQVLGADKSDAANRIMRPLLALQAIIRQRRLSADEVIKAVRLALESTNPPQEP